MAFFLTYLIGIFET